MTPDEYRDARLARAAELANEHLHKGWDQARECHVPDQWHGTTSQIAALIDEILSPEFIDGYIQGQEAADDADA